MLCVWAVGRRRSMSPYTSAFKTFFLLEEARHGVEEGEQVQGQAVLDGTPGSTTLPSL